MTRFQTDCVSSCEGQRRGRDKEWQPNPSLPCWQHKKAHLKTFSAKLSLFSGCFYWDWHSLSPSTCDNTLYFHVLNSIFSTYCNSLDGKQNHNVVSQSNGNTSDCCHELVLKSYSLNYIRYLLGSHSLSWKLAVLCHVSNHTTSKKYWLYLFFWQFSQYATYVSIPVLCCRQLGTRSEFGVQIPVEGVPVWVSPLRSILMSFPVQHLCQWGERLPWGWCLTCTAEPLCPALLLALPAPGCISWMICQLSLVFPWLQPSQLSRWPQKPSLETQGKGSGGKTASSWKVGKVDSFFQHQSWFVLPESIHEQTASAVYQQHE